MPRPPLSSRYAPGYISLTPLKGKPQIYVAGAEAYRREGAETFHPLPLVINGGGGELYPLLLKTLVFGVEWCDLRRQNDKFRFLGHPICRDFMRNICFSFRRFYLNFACLEIQKSVFREVDKISQTMWVNIYCNFKKAQRSFSGQTSPGPPYPQKPDYG